MISDIRSKQLFASIINISDINIININVVNIIWLQLIN